MFEADPPASLRLRLAALTPEALQQMNAWLPGALAPDWSLADLEGALPRSHAVLFEDQAGSPAGLAVVFLDRPQAEAATVAFLTIDPLRRFRGLGGEAALALERHLRERLGMGKVYAPVPDNRGLAVYFWLRLGYRPLTAAESPGPLVGLNPEPKAGIWMLRAGAQSSR